MTVVSPTDRPKSVRNRCVIDVFGGVFVLSHCFLDLSVGEGALSLYSVRSLPFSLSINRMSDSTSTIKNFHSRAET